MEFTNHWRGRLVFMLVAAFVGAVVATGSAHAMNLGDTVQVHGYGSWAYKRVSNEGYTYAEGTEEGNYTNVSGSLNVSAQPTEDVMAVIQANWTLMEGRTLDTNQFTFPVAAPQCAANPVPVPPGATHCTIAVPVGTISRSPDNDIEIDYAFAEWRFSDALRLRAGQVKLPFGLYTEIYDVGTLRPFLDVPQGIYGAQAVVAEAYQGGGLTGNIYTDDWGLQYDVYVGQVISDLELSPTNIVETALSDVFGARLHVTTPIEGLSFGTSGYIGLKSDDTFSFPPFALRTERGSVGAHIEYSGDALLVRMEGVYTNAKGFYEAAAAYAEVAYMFFDHVQLAGRLDYYKGDLTENPVLSAALPKSIDRHVDYGVGLNYWFNSFFVIKTAYHYIDGNRYSQPEAIGAFVTFVTPYAGPPLDESNHLFEAGAQFSF